MGNLPIHGSYGISLPCLVHRANQSKHKEPLWEMMKPLLLPHKLLKLMEERCKEKARPQRSSSSLPYGRKDKEAFPRIASGGFSSVFSKSLKDAFCPIFVI